MPLPSVGHVQTTGCALQLQNTGWFLNDADKESFDDDTQADRPFKSMGWAHNPSLRHLALVRHGPTSTHEEHAFLTDVDQGASVCFLAAEHRSGVSAQEAGRNL